MNWLFILVVVILILFTLHGYKKGFIRVIFSLLSLIITILLVSFVVPKIGDFLKEETPLYTSLKENYIERLENKQEEKKPINQDSEVDLYGIPSILLASLTEDNNNIFEEMKTQGQSMINEYICGYMADLTINLIAFIAAFFVVTILLRMTVFTLDIISNLPIIKGFNKIAGLFAGLTEGVIIVWIAFLIITIFIGSETGVQLRGFIYDSKFLTYMYNNNYLLKLI